MKEKAPTVEFRFSPTKTTPKPPPDAKAERLRQDRAARKARNFALALCIDELVRSGEVANLAAVARTCRVSRARVSKLITLLAMAPGDQERVTANAGHFPRTACPRRPHSAAKVGPMPPMW